MERGLQLTCPLITPEVGAGQLYVGASHICLLLPQILSS